MSSGDAVVVNFAVPEAYCSSSTQPFLAAKIITSSLRYLYTVRLSRLYSSELSLRSGRFEYFSRERQQYRVVLPQKVSSGDALLYWYGGLLDWIGDHCETETWSCGVLMHSVVSGDFEFSFSHPTASVTFALCYR